MKIDEQRTRATRTRVRSDCGPQFARWRRRLADVLSVLVVMQLAIASAETLSASTIRFAKSTEAGQLPILMDGQVVAVYVFADPEISRPYFSDLRAPGAPQVSRNHPPLTGKDIDDHATYHPGLWMAFGDVSGSDYWRLKAAVRHVEFIEPPSGGEGQASFAVRNRYTRQDRADQTVCEEICRYTILADPAGYLILWDATFRAEEEFYFGDQEEMGLGVRVATQIRVDRDQEGDVPAGNGTMIDSEGRRNGKEIWGHDADWCDYSGSRGEWLVGMTIFCHPDNFRRSWFHARDYGLLLANPFGRQAFGHGDSSRVVVQPGESLRLRYGVLVHATRTGQAPELSRAYARYVTSAGE